VKPRIEKLGLFKQLLSELSRKEKISENEFKLLINSELPYENADQMIDTMVDWGRYARLFKFDTQLKIFSPEENT
jgi:NitT/TauT family transport system ATP-binding protein